MLPVGTLCDRDFPLRRRRSGAASDPGHIRTTRRPRFFRPWPGWRQVALMGRTDQRFRSSEEGFRTMSAVSSESHEPAVEPGQPAAGQADFGANEWLVEELYQRYLADPGSVDRAWWSFFADYHPALSNGTGPQPVINLKPAPAAAPPAPAQPLAPAQAPAPPPTAPPV